MACKPACIRIKSICPEPVTSIMHAPPVVVNLRASAAETIACTTSFTGIMGRSTTSGSSTGVTVE